MVLYNMRFTRHQTPIKTFANKRENMYNHRENSVDILSWDVLRLVALLQIQSSYQPISWGLQFFEKNQNPSSSSKNQTQFQLGFY